MTRHLTELELAQAMDGDAVPSVREHLAMCAVCRRDLESLLAVSDAVLGVPPEHAPDVPWESIRSRAEAPDSNLGASPRGPILVRDDAKSESAASGSQRGGHQRPWPWSRVSVRSAATVIIALGIGALAGRSSAPGPVAPILEIKSPVPAAGLKFDELPNRGPAAAPGPDSALVARAQLEGHLEAAIESVNRAPFHPALNGYLFAVVDELHRASGDPYAISTGRPPYGPLRELNRNRARSVLDSLAVLRWDSTGIEGLPDTGIVGGYGFERTFFGVRLGVDSGGLAVLEVVPRGPGARAGLRAGDVLTGAAGKHLRSMMALRAVLAGTAGEVELSVRRDEEVFTATVTPKVDL